MRISDQWGRQYEGGEPDYEAMAEAKAEERAEDAAYSSWLRDEA